MSAANIEALEKRSRVIGLVSARPRRTEITHRAADPHKQPRKQYYLQKFAIQFDLVNGSYVRGADLDCPSFRWSQNIEDLQDCGGRPAKPDRPAVQVLRDRALWHRV